MQLQIRIVTTLALCAVLSGCESNTFADHMVGCYTPRQNGTPEVKISKGIDGYYVSLWAARAWSDSAAMRRATFEELNRLFGADTAGIAEGWVATTGPFGVFRAKHDAMVPGKDSTSDYVALMFIGRGAVYKIPCEASQR